MQAPLSPVPAGHIAGLCLDNPDVVDAIRHHIISMSGVTLSAPLPERPAFALDRGAYEVLQ